MEANAGGLRAVEIERLDALLDVGSQFVPTVALGEDAFGQAFGAKAAVRLLRDFEHDFVHNSKSTRSDSFRQVATPPPSPHLTVSEP